MLCIAMGKLTTNFENAVSLKKSAEEAYPYLSENEKVSKFYEDIAEGLI